MKYDNSLFYIEKINPRPTKKFVSRFECFVALSLPFAEQRIEVQGQRRKEKSEGATSPLSPLGLAEAPLRRRPRGRLSLPPSTPRSRYVPGGSSSPIPRSARILKVLVVNICFPHHRGFVIGERQWRPVRIHNR